MIFSFQLYSARNFAPVTDIFPRLKALGYGEVEGFGGLYGEADELAAALKSSDLVMPTGHFGLDMLEDTCTAMKIAEKLGIKTLICPAIPPKERSKNADGWKKLAGKLAALGEIYNKAGFKFGWHNHDYEFAPIESGELPMDLLLEGAPDIVWQCDVAWLVKGGEDPLERFQDKWTRLSGSKTRPNKDLEPSFGSTKTQEALGWFERYGGRIASVHVKDIARQGECVDEDGWADVGHGTMDWKTIFAAIRQKTACTSFVMEHDNPNDVVRFATRSIRAAEKLGKLK